MDIRRFDVPVNQAAGVRLGKRGARLHQDVHRPVRRNRPELLHQGLQVQSIQQLHHEIERAVFRDAEIVQLHRVRRPQIRRCLGLAAKALDRELRPRAVHRPDHFRPDELDRRGAGKHAVGGRVDLAHAAAPEQLSQPVAPQLPRAGDLLPQPGHHVRDDDRHAEQQIIGVMHDEPIRQRPERVVPGKPGNPHSHRLHRRGDEAGNEHLPWRDWHDRREHEHHRADPADHRIQLPIFGNRAPMHHDGQLERRQDQVREPKIQNEDRRAGAAPHIENQRDRHGAAERRHMIREIELRPTGVTQGEGSGMSSQRCDEPQAGGHQRQDPQPSRRLPQEILRQRPASRATAIRPSRRAADGTKRETRFEHLDPPRWHNTPRCSRPDPDDQLTTACSRRSPASAGA